MATGFKLPQMKSIWLDEDQEAEKLYAQQFMGSDEDESVAFKMVNSDKPLLDNKKRIELPPLAKNSMIRSFDLPPSAKPEKKMKKKGLLAFFKSKEYVKPKKISTPFAFQHISHANTKDGFESDEEASAANLSPLEEELPSEQGPLRQAFVTQSIPTAHKESFKISDRKRASMVSRRSLSGSISTTSSNYSRSSAGRIVSSSTMATSIHHEASPSPSRLSLLNAIEKKNFKERKARDSKDSEVSLEFLKSYDFPTLLDAKSTSQFYSKITPIIETAASEISSIQIHDVGDDDNKSIASLPVINKTSSDSKLLTTPEIENEWFDENTSTTRRSVDDILLCYHIPSDAGSFTQTPFTSPVKPLF